MLKPIHYYSFDATTDTFELKPDLRASTSADTDYYDRTVTVTVEIKYQQLGWPSGKTISATLTIRELLCHVVAPNPLFVTTGGPSWSVAKQVTSSFDLELGAFTIVPNSVSCGTVAVTSSARVNYAGYNPWTAS